MLCSRKEKIKKRLCFDGYDKYFEALTKYNMLYLLINNENLLLEVVGILTRKNMNMQMILIMMK